MKNELRQPLSKMGMGTSPFAPNPGAASQDQARDEARENLADAIALIQVSVNTPNRTHTIASQTL